jgi:hypothetical protein
MACCSYRRLAILLAIRLDAVSAAFNRIVYRFKKIRFFNSVVFLTIHHDTSRVPSDPAFPVVTLPQLTCYALHIYWLFIVLQNRFLYQNVPSGGKYFVLNFRTVRSQKHVHVCSIESTLKYISTSFNHEMLRCFYRAHINI